MPGTMNLDDLRLVFAVAQQGSFVAAARQSETPPSTVSRAVARFEASMGVRLFQRTSRRVSLTHEGERLLERAAPLLDELSAVVDHLSDDATAGGRLRVTAPTASGSGRIATSLFSFAEAYPRVQLELMLTNTVVDLVEHGVDLAFRAGPVEQDGLIAQRLWSVPFALGASRSFVQRELGRRRTVDRARLSSLPAIATNERRPWRFRGPAGQLVEVEPRARTRFNDLRVAIDAARHGLGVVRGPSELLAAADLVLLTLAPDLGEVEPRELFAVYPSRRLVPPRVRRAIEWVRSCDEHGRPVAASRRRAP